LSEYVKYLPLAKPKIGVAGKTGSWRTEKPIYDPSKCIKCDLCWLHCPEGTIDVGVSENGYVRIDYDYCKGCGICANVCPVKAISMVPER